MIKMVVYDFDGVLTDNRVWTREDGRESVACNRSDGWWLKEISKLGIEQIILSTEKNPVVLMRAKKLGIAALQGIADKRSALLQILDEKRIPLDAVCYVGNELNDLGCMQMIGLPVCPKDSHPKILEISKVVLNANGGTGIVRHLHDLLIKMEGNTSTDHPALEFFRRKIESNVLESIRVKQALLDDKRNLQLLEMMGKAGQTALQEGKKIIFAGNGGSFADSMHLAAELVSKLQIQRRPLAAIALGCGNSNLTAIGNDYGYEFTFSREIEAIGQEGDLFIAISTSGKSPNILNAIHTAKEKGLLVFGWSGESGGTMAKITQTLCIPSSDVARIQECHILCGHIFCQIVEAPFL